MLEYGLQKAHLELACGRLEGGPLVRIAFDLLKFVEILIEARLARNSGHMNP